MNRNDLIRRGDVMDLLEKLVWTGEMSATVALKVAGIPQECSCWYQNEKGEVRCGDCDWLAATGGPEALAEAVEEHRYCGGCGARMVGEIDVELVPW